MTESRATHTRHTRPALGSSEPCTPVSTSWGSQVRALHGALRTEAHRTAKPAPQAGFALSGAEAPKARQRTQAHTEARLATHERHISDTSGEARMAIEEDEERPNAAEYVERAIIEALAKSTHAPKGRMDAVRLTAADLVGATGLTLPLVRGGLYGLHRRKLVVAVEKDRWVLA